MRLVIDISKDRYDEIMAMDWKNCRLFFDEELRAIHDGEALEQEPCDDCISREAVSKLLNDGWWKGIYPREAIMALPPVSPQPKPGYISIDDVMSVFDDFMRGDADENDTERFLEMLKDKAERSDKE